MIDIAREIALNEAATQSLLERAQEAYSLAWHSDVNANQLLDHLSEDSSKWALTRAMP